MDSHIPVEPEEARTVPALSIVFGFGPMLPILVAAVLVWLASPIADIVARLAILWAAAILAFLAGVRRGLSFRTAGGARLSEIASMLWLFSLAFAALVIPSTSAVLSVLLLGYSSLAIFDFRAAGRGEAPPFFARLRPAQMALAIIGLLALLLHAG